MTARIGSRTASALCGERAPLLGRELDLVDLLESRASELAGNAEEEIPQSVLALQPRGARKNALLVLGDRLAHLHRCGRRRVVRGAGLEVLDDLSAAGAGARDDRVELVLGDELRDRDAAHAGVRDEWHHRVAVSAEHHRLDVAHRDVGASARKLR